MGLYTDSTLFKVNRDDDLESGDAMEELYTWNESKLNVKLDLVKNSSARELLSRLLSNDKDKRYQNMDEVLVAMKNVTNINKEILKKLDKVVAGVEKIDVKTDIIL